MCITGNRATQTRAHELKRANSKHGQTTGASLFNPISSIRCGKQQSKRTKEMSGLQQARPYGWMGVRGVGDLGPWKGGPNRRALNACPLTWSSSWRSLWSCASSCRLWSSSTCIRASRRPLCWRSSLASAKSSESRFWGVPSGETSPLGWRRSWSRSAFSRSYSSWSSLWATDDKTSAKYAVMRRLAWLEIQTPSYRMNEWMNEDVDGRMNEWMHIWVQKRTNCWVWFTSRTETINYVGSMHE